MGFSVKIGIFVFFLLIAEIFGRSVKQIDENELNGVDSNILTDCNCESRYHKHYETKGCVIEEVDSCGCPTKYVCPSATDTPEKTVCVYENEEYKIGSRIKLTDACRVCRCVGGESPRISCRMRECPQLDPVDGDNCFLVYAKDRCCPMRYECVTETAEKENLGGAVCVHENVTYPFGAKIYPSEDPCIVCDCDENWNGIEDARCRRQNCMLENNKHRLDGGCIPVYHETKCCPIEFYCPENKEMSSVIIENYDIQEDVDDDGTQCVFGGKSYEYGTELVVENSCIRCQCSVPPDFTCIHKSCPRPPRTDNCFEHYRDGECCPHYECFFGDGAEVSDANYTSGDTYASVVLEAMDVEKRSAEVDSSSNLLFEENVSVGNGDNIFDPEVNTTVNSNSTDEIECPTPICADETCVIKIPPGHLCPTCVCQDSDTREKNSQEEISGVDESIKGNGTEVSTSSVSENVSSPLEHEESSSVASAEKIVYDEGERMAPVIQKGDTANETSEGVGEASHADSEGPVPVEQSDASRETLIGDTGSEKDVPRGPRRKRSVNLDPDSNRFRVVQQQWRVFQDDQEEEALQGSLQRLDSSETERETQDETDEDFDELKLFPKREDETTEASEMSLESVIWASEVPGCPAPLCENSSCRIGILPGHQCPTCICEERRNRQP